MQRRAEDRQSETEQVRVRELRMQPVLLTIPEAAAVLAVGRTTVYELIATGDLEVVHI